MTHIIHRFFSNLLILLMIPSLFLTHLVLHNVRNAHRNATQRNAIANSLFINIDKALCIIFALKTIHNNYNLKLVENLYLMFIMQIFKN